MAASVTAGCGRAPIVAAIPAASRLEERRPSSLRTPLGVFSPDEAVVRVVTQGVGCSGILITSALVLTAHHCVVQRDANGEILERNLPASALAVEIGGDYLPWATIPVSALVAPACGYRGGTGDIAILVLSRKLVGVAVMPTRIAQPPRLGEIIEPVGFGRCARSKDGIYRSRRAGGPVEGIGPSSMSAWTSICPGDSGGPARSAGGDVVGVISAGEMDGSDETRDPTTFTRLDAWRPLFARAQRIVDGSSSPADATAVADCPAD
jgi:hypothetical protein